MENCLAEFEAQLCLFWQAELENISTRRLPPTLLWFVLCFVCLLRWATPLAGRLSSLVYASSHNVWILSLTFVWFFGGGLRSEQQQQHSHRDSDTAGSAMNWQPVASSFFPQFSPENICLGLRLLISIKQMWQEVVNKRRVPTRCQSDALSSAGVRTDTQTHKRMLELLSTHFHIVVNSPGVSSACWG